MAERALPKEEFEDRYRRLRERMVGANLDAVLACSPGTQFWLTGCVGLRVSIHESTFGYDTLYPKIVLPAEGEPTLIGLRICAEAYAQEPISPTFAPLPHRCGSADQL
jgi:Xaa-Pro aminopeptidase